MKVFIFSKIHSEWILLQKMNLTDVKIICIVNIFLIQLLFLKLPS